jgi:hypothetical protein
VPGRGTYAISAAQAPSCSADRPCLQAATGAHADPRHGAFRPSRAAGKPGQTAGRAAPRTRLPGRLPCRQACHGLLPHPPDPANVSNGGQVGGDTALMFTVLLGRIDISDAVSSADAMDAHRSHAEYLTGRNAHCSPSRATSPACTSSSRLRHARCPARHCKRSRTVKRLCRGPGYCPCGCWSADAAGGRASAGCVRLTTMRAGAWCGDFVRENGSQMFATFGTTSLAGPARMFVRTSTTC